MSCFKQKEVAIVRWIDTPVVVLGHDRHHDKNWLLVIWPQTRKITRVDPHDLIKKKEFLRRGGKILPFPKPPRRIEDWS